MRTPKPIGATILGYPRIGPKRELKKALERYWSDKIDVAELREVAAGLRAQTRATLADAGLDSLPGNIFSYYDQVLDTAALFNAVPARYRELGLSEVDTYFAMARGNKQVAPLEMTKWFDTNYHYLVPEIGEDTHLKLVGSKPVDDLLEAASQGHNVRPVLVGPVTFLLLSKGIDGYEPLRKLDELVEAYVELLAKFAEAGADWVQLDEPAFVADRDAEQLAALRKTYTRLADSNDRPALLVTGPHGDLGDALPVLAGTPVEAIGVDLVKGDSDGVSTVPGLRNKTLVAGIVDGHNVWRTDPDAALTKLEPLRDKVKTLNVGTSCSLLHVPYTVGAETAADRRVLSWLAFADEKLAEVVTLQRAFDGADADLESMRTPVADRRLAAPDDAVRNRAAAVTDDQLRRGDARARSVAQQAKLNLPSLPTTTIGSFPQTPEVRIARAELRRGNIDLPEYERQMEAEIQDVIRLQERIGLDVLVHGEPERNDMVQYFAEQLDGFLATEFGWVQSYGSRCVRPPILYGDVSRPDPMTVRWSEFAQSLTDKPVKGMLTGPVTILAWSFVRDDQSLADTARQVALAIADEVTDLELAGIGIIQVDEPALRELLPLRESQHAEYLKWAVDAFRLATASAADETAIHTHMCYSEFGEITAAIDAIDADVTSIEAARSKMEVVADIRANGFERGVGPGVYDIHSPRVPDTAEIDTLLRAALDGVPAKLLWVNPDCGLKTRKYSEIEPALRHLVEAAQRVRATL